MCESTEKRLYMYFCTSGNILGPDNYKAVTWKACYAVMGQFILRYTTQLHSSSPVMEFLKMESDVPPYYPFLAPLPP